ncbi:RNA polymerase sigma factor [Eggerthella sinensis]|nr:RNA polymerase sigma factor [Eggerthella sinensis]
MVYRLALSQTHEPADASDICQETFISLLKDVTVFRDDEHLKAWLIRVAINRCHQLRRTASRHRTQPLPDDESLLPTSPAASEALLANDVWRVLGTLPQKYRAVVHLHYVEGYATEEIAEILKCRPATVRSRLHRARAQLKTLLEQEESRERIADGRVSCFDGRGQEPEFGA